MTFLTPSYVSRSRGSLLVVTGVLQGCYMAVTRAIAKMLQGSYRVVT